MTSICKTKTSIPKLQPDHGDYTNPKPVTPTIKPELHQVVDSLPDIRVLPVEIGLL
jgi:hypothetical protein